MTQRFALIGGTGISAALPSCEPLDIETPYGDVRLGYARVGDVDWVVLRRHGDEATPAHRVNHHAHVDALARAGVSAVFGIASVGALDPALAPQSLVAPDDLLDLSAPLTFFDERAVHVDMRSPFCPEMRRALLHDAAVAVQGVYAQVRGPRLETPAEVRALRILGGSLVGMSVGPEATLARERGLCYAPLCIVTNSALDGSALEIREAAGRSGERAVRLVLDAAGKLSATRACGCRAALDAARL